MPRLLVAALLIATALPARATVLRRATLEELVVSSAFVVHARVRAVDDSLAERNGGRFRTAVELEVLEGVKGTGKAASWRIELPGGRYGTRAMRIPGLPSFVPGEEVVLLLTGSSEKLVPNGFAQGVFRVRREGDRAEVMRALGDAVILDQQGKPAVLAPAPRTLDELLTSLRAIAHAEVQP